MLQLLAELQRDMGLSILFITHDLSVLAQVSDRVAVMYAGRLVEDRTGGIVFADPRHPYSQALEAPSPRSVMSTTSSRRWGWTAIHRIPRELPTGCTFHPRCPRAEPRCSEIDPPPVVFAPIASRRASSSNRNRWPRSERGHERRRADADHVGSVRRRGSALEVQDLHVTFAPAPACSARRTRRRPARSTAWTSRSAAEISWRWRANLAAARRRWLARSWGSPRGHGRTCSRASRSASKAEGVPPPGADGLSRPHRLVESSPDRLRRGGRRPADPQRSRIERTEHRRPGVVPGWSPSAVTGSSFDSSTSSRAVSANAWSSPVPSRWSRRG